MTGGPRTATLYWTAVTLGLLLGGTVVATEFLGRAGQRESGLAAGEGATGAGFSCTCAGAAAAAARSRGRRSSGWPSCLR